MDRKSRMDTSTFSQVAVGKISILADTGFAGGASKGDGTGKYHVETRATDHRAWRIEFNSNAEANHAAGHFVAVGNAGCTNSHCGH